MCNCVYACRDVYVPYITKAMVPGAKIPQTLLILPIYFYDHNHIKEGGLKVLMRCRRGGSQGRGAVVNSEASAGAATGREKSQPEERQQGPGSVVEAPRLI